MLLWALACAGGTDDTGSSDSKGADDTAPVDSASDDTGGSDDTATPPFEGRLGRTWRFDLTTAAIPEPADAGELLRSYLGSHLLTQVVGEGETDMTLRLAWSDGSADSQALAVPTRDVVATPNEGTFTTEPTDLVFHALDAMACEEAVLSGTMNADYTAVADASLTFRGDTAALMDILSEEEPTAFCELLESFGSACEPCVSGADTCAWFTFSGLAGEDISPLDLVVVEG